MAGFPLINISPTTELTENCCLYFRAKLSNTVRRDNHRPGGTRWNEVRVSKTELLLTWCSFCDLLYRYLHSHLHHPSDNNNNHATMATNDAVWLCYWWWEAHSTRSECHGPGAWRVPYMWVWTGGTYMHVRGLPGSHVRRLRQIRLLLQVSQRSVKTKFLLLTTHLVLVKTYDWFTY